MKFQLLISENNFDVSTFNKYVTSLLFQNLYTSSPFSEPLSLEMRNAPPGEVPQRMNPKNIIENDSGVSKITTPQQGVMLWLIGPIIAAAILCVLLVFFFITKRYLRGFRYLPSLFFEIIA